METDVSDLSEAGAVTGIKGLNVENQIKQINPFSFQKIRFFVSKHRFFQQTYTSPMQIRCKSLASPISNLFPYAL